MDLLGDLDEADRLRQGHDRKARVVGELGQVARHLRQLGTEFDDEPGHVVLGEDVQVGPDLGRLADQRKARGQQQLAPFEQAGGVAPLADVHPSHGTVEMSSPTDDLGHAPPEDGQGEHVANCR
nr:hypothetical protein [Amycolatopsis methanolica]